MPQHEPGVTEMLANISIGAVVIAALVLTLLRFAMLAGRSGIVVSIRETVESLLAAAVFVFLLLRPFVVQAYYIPTPSMEPTLLGHDHPAPAHDHLFLNKMVFRMRDPVQGEICVFRAPKVADVNAQLTGQPPQENVLIKRAVAIGPGSVEVKPDAAGQLKVWVNGKVTEEPYIAEPMQETGNEKFALNGPLYLKEGQIFMMGDNRNRSSDSRYWGPVERSRVIGRAEVIFWPLNRIGRLR